MKLKEKSEYREFQLNLDKLEGGFRGDYKLLFTETSKKEETNIEKSIFYLESVENFLLLFNGEFNLENFKSGHLDLPRIFYRYNFIITALFEVSSHERTKEQIDDFIQQSKLLYDEMNTWLDDNSLWLFVVALWQKNYANLLNSQTKSFIEKYAENTISTYKKDLEDKQKKLEKDINSFEANIKKTIDNLEQSLTQVQFATTIHKLEEAKSHNFVKIQSWKQYLKWIVFGFIAVFGLSLISNEKVINTAQNINNDDLRMYFIVKVSILSLVIFGVLTYSLGVCINMLKSYLSIDTIYEHKLALIGSFKELIGKDILKDERSQVIEKVVEQIITSDNLHLNNTQFSSPSIINTIIEKVASSGASK